MNRPAGTSLTRPPQTTVRTAVLLTVLAASPLQSASAEKSQDGKNCEALARQTAVTLNYCRAAFHRIQNCPAKPVLIEERERILNNLNLNVVADEEVVKLYGAVLHEISEIRIAETEKDIVMRRHRREFRRAAVGAIVSFSLQMAAGQYLNALRSGANCWWDYRTMVWNRELDAWAIDKERLRMINDKSTLFLDTFWKMTRKRKISDKWLIRSTDLDELDKAIRETDPEVRLRVLKRMESFLECYPPYWYYVGRTQQSLGKLAEAVETYRKLEELGGGHFRKDGLLASATANRAAIEDYLQRKSAPETAARALEFATDSWEANLMCAAVLNRHGKTRAAEDALLRNLDTGLETERSLTALVEFYLAHGETKKLQERFSDAKTLQQIALPTLLRCADAVDATTAANIRRWVAGSLSVDFDRRFGPDDLILTATGNWNLDETALSVLVGSTKLGNPQVDDNADRFTARFRNAVDLGSVLRPRPLGHPLRVELEYPDGSELTVHLQPAAPAGGPMAGVARVVSAQNVRAGVASEYRIVAFDLGKGRTDFGADSKRESPSTATDADHEIPEPKRTARPHGIPVKADDRPPTATPAREIENVDRPAVETDRTESPKWAPSRPALSQPDRPRTQSSSPRTPADSPPSGTEFLPPPPKR